MDTAIVLGVSGQCGSYLAELLLNKGYNVIGTVRRSSVDTTERVKHLNKNPNFKIVECDITDITSIGEVLSIKPQLIFNCAAQSHVGTSFSQPSYTFQVDAVGVLNILETIRLYTPESRLIQFSTSEMFGSNYTTQWKSYCDNNYIDTTNIINVQNEFTSFSPNSPYAVAKVAAFNLVSLYREAYKLNVCSGIMFNMESPRRGENFVTRKITKYIAELVTGKRKDKLQLGNIESFRDWGFVPDYMEAVYKIITADKLDDYVVCTGETHTVKEFLEVAFSLVGLNWEDYVWFNKDLVRPMEVDYLCGDASKIKEKLGWEPKVKFNELVKMMVESDIEKVGGELAYNGSLLTVM